MKVRLMPKLLLQDNHKERPNPAHWCVLLCWFLVFEKGWMMYVSDPLQFHLIYTGSFPILNQIVQPKAHVCMCIFLDECASTCNSVCVITCKFLYRCVCVSSGAWLLLCLCLNACVFIYVCTCAHKPVHVSVARRLSPGIAVPLQCVCMVVDSVDGNVW